MEFMLTFRGFVPGNSGSNKDKHDIRLKLHEQLKNLPERDERFRGAKHPVASIEKRTVAHDEAIPFNYARFAWEVGGYDIVPIVQRQHHTVCEIEILWIRQVRTGAPSGTDLDNCLKNISDALTVPFPNQLTGIPAPTPENRRLYCLLEDDSFITGLSIKAFRSLEDLQEMGQVQGMKNREKPEKQVDLLVHVTLRSMWAAWGPGGVR